MGRHVARVGGKHKRRGAGQFDGSSRRRVIVADGYHRLCAIYRYHEDAVIRGKKKML